MEHIFFLNFSVVFVAVIILTCQPTYEHASRIKHIIMYTSCILHAQQVIFSFKEEKDEEEEEANNIDTNSNRMFIQCYTSVALLSYHLALNVFVILISFRIP